MKIISIVLSIFLLQLNQLALAASPIVDRLLNIEDPGYNDALDEMANLSEPAKEKLIDDLEKQFKTRSNPDERANAILAIGDLGSQVTNKKKATSILLLAIKDKNEFVKQAAISGLQRIHQTSKTDEAEIIKAWTQALNDQSKGVIGKALDAFIRVGAAGKSAAPTVRKLLKHKDPGVKELAQMALEAMGEKK